MLERGEAAGAGGGGKPDALGEFDMRAAGVGGHLAKK